MSNKDKKIIPPLGAPTNLRPAGAHKDKRRLSRQEIKAQLQKEKDTYEQD